jgi:hypothetical protein
MGGSKAQTVGYKYFAGMHMVLCHGPIDKITRITVDQKELWVGSNTGGVGVASFASGTITLTNNPTFGISGVGVGGNGFVFGGNVTVGGTKESTASNLAVAINGLAIVNATASGNVVTITAATAGPSGDSITLSKTEFLTNNIDISGATLSGGSGRIVVNKPKLFGGESREGGITGELDFMPGGVSQLPNDYLVSRLGSLVPAFRGVVSIVLRQMYLSMNPYLKTWGFTVQRIHVQQDGLAQWQDSLSQIDVTVYNAAGAAVPLAAMNPAHIIRECLTNKLWGMGYNEGDINEASFLAAAIPLKAELMGMSLLWDTQTSIEEFVKIVLQHIDASLYVDRKTGQFVLKLIRGGYSVPSLLVLDPSNIDKIEDFKRPAFGELNNSVTVNYWDGSKDQTGSVTVQDIALSQEQGGESNTTITYEGFVDPATASRVAQRDLRSLSTPLITCTIYTTKIARDLNIGDVFVLSWPDYQIESVVMRVTGIAYGDGKTRRVRIQCAQDVFSYPEDAFVTKPPSAWVDPIGEPGAVLFQKGFEMPYFELVRNNGQSVVDSSIASNPYIGYVGGACSSSAVSSINALIYTDDGSGYEEVAQADFCAGAFLVADIEYLTTTFDIGAGSSLSLVDPGEWLQIDSELMAVVSLVGDVLTVKRGVLDTVPALHTAGATVLFWDGLAGIDPTEYVASDIVDVKFTAANGSGVYPVDSAIGETVNVVGRAAKPFAPGGLRFGGIYFPTAEIAAPIIVAWNTRNRVFQTGGSLIGFEDGGITPESGQTTTLNLYNKLGLLFYSEVGLTGSSFTITAPIIAGLDEKIFVECFSIRDGIESFQRHYVEVKLVSGIDGGALAYVMDDTTTPPAGGAINFVM